MISRGILVWKHSFNQAPTCSAEREERLEPYLRKLKAGIEQ